MSTRALTVRPAAQASGRLRKAAEHYVRNGCKLLRPSLIYAGYAPATADNPTLNGLGHDRLVQVASHWNKGSQATARSHLADAIATLSDIMNDATEPAQARGAAAKIIIDVSGKEKEGEDTSKVTREEQGKWIALIRHWKRVFLRRGILMGMSVGASNCAAQCYGQTDQVHMATRAERILCELNYALGKGPQPAWMENEDESLLGSESDTRPGTYIEAEVVEERADPEPPDTGSGPTDTE